MVSITETIMNLKIKDLIYRKDKIMPEKVCQYFIDFFKNNIEKTGKEASKKLIEGEPISYQLDNVNRRNRAACTINLNEDYEGGEFSFFSGKELYTFKTGDSIIFPAEPIFIHGTKKIKKGTRYSINCFLYNINQANDIK